MPEQELSIINSQLSIKKSALLLVGEKKHEAAYRLHQRLGHRARVLMGSVQALQIADGRLLSHATPFTDRYPWEESPAALDCAPGSVHPSAKASVHPSAKASGISSAQITRILILPSDVAFLSSEDFDPARLFTEQAPVAASLSDGQRPVLGDSVAEQKAEQPDHLPSLIKSLVLPDGLPLRLRALTLAGAVAKLF